MTIRRDLAEPEAKGLVVRTHGGVLPRDGILLDYDGDVRKVQHVPGKQAIAAVSWSTPSNRCTVP